LKEVEEVLAKIGVLKRDLNLDAQLLEVNISIESPLKDLEETEAE
jgi:hypothetical protein